MGVTTSGESPRRRRLAAFTALWGIAATVTWAAETALGGRRPRLHASGAEIVTAFAGSDGSAGSRSPIDAGRWMPDFGGLAVLAAVVVTLAARQAGAGIAARRIVQIAGGLAAALSIAQIVLAVRLAHTTWPGTAHSLYAAVNRLAGVELLVLAGLVVGIAAADLSARWLRWVGIATAPLLAAAGVGCLLLLSGLAALAYAAVPLFLLFVAGTGLALTGGPRPPVSQSPAATA